MEKKRLFYKHRIQVMLSKVPELAKSMNMQLDKDFILYHNDICPLCEKKMKLSHDRTVKNVGAFSLGVYQHSGYIVPYVLCTDCTNEPSFTISSKRKQEEDSMKIEDYMFALMPHLAKNADK